MKLNLALLLLIYLCGCNHQPKPQPKQGLYRHNNLISPNGTVENFIKYKGHAELYDPRICGENKRCMTK